ncbi:MAG: nucleotide exchange factor GrpE [Pirellulales bacterium]
MTAEPNNSPEQSEEQAPESTTESATSEAGDVDAGSVDQVFSETVSMNTPPEVDEVADLKDKLAAAENRVLLAQADLENFRKRIRREMEDATKFADMPLLASLMPVVDNLNRAIDSIDETEKSSGLAEGVTMVFKQLMEVLAQRGCKPIEANGQPFDPNRHEAILHQPNAEVPAETVLMETQVGYVLHDRVVRPSQVIVSKQVEPVATEPETNSIDEDA